MPTDFPTSIDTFVAPGPTDHMDDPGVEGDVVAEQLTAAVLAIEAVIGETGSADPTSVEFRLTSLGLLGLKADSTPNTASQTPIADGEDITGTSVTFVLEAGRVYEYIVENLNMVTGVVGQKWNCLVLQDGSIIGITGAVTAAASDQAFLGSGVVRVEGSGSSTIKVQMNLATGTGECSAFGSAASPVRAYLKDIGEAV